MIKAIKIWWFKRKARAAYLDYQHHTLGLSVSTSWMLRGPELATAARKFNTAMDKLASLGEMTPSTRLPESAP